MPPGQLTFADDGAHTELLLGLRAHFSADGMSDPIGMSDMVDVLVTSSVPDRPARHVVIIGDLPEGLDEWDRAVAPQTVAGALWIPPGQEPFAPVVAWLLLRAATPTTPLSDLTDDNGRALRWSVAAAQYVEFPAAADIIVNEDEVRAWIDEQPQVQELGRAVEGVGGDTAEEVLDSVERFQDALLALDDLATMPAMEQTRTLANAVAEQLRQVQRSGLARWRSGKARMQAAEATSQAAKDLARQRLLDLIAARTDDVIRAERAELDRARAGEVRTVLVRTIEDLSLPVRPNFSESPRSWSDSAPPAQRYLLVNDDQFDMVTPIEDASVRADDAISIDTALPALLQSGFSLPALR